MKIVWMPSALRDMESISDYISEENPSAAEHLLKIVYEKVKNLGTHTHIGRAGRITGTRELVITDTPYVVPYRVRAERIEILAVFHGARHWPIEF